MADTPRKLVGYAIVHSQTSDVLAVGTYSEPHAWFSACRRTNKLEYELRDSGYRSFHATIELREIT